MMQLTEGLKDRVWGEIESMADPTALPQLRSALAPLPYQERETIYAAAITLAGAWADAALVVGFKLATNPALWIFTTEE